MLNPILELEEALLIVSYSKYNLDFIKQFLIDNYSGNDMTRIYVLSNDDGENIFSIEYSLIIEFNSKNYSLNILV